MMDDAEKESLAQEVFENYRQIGREYMEARNIVLSRSDGNQKYPIEIDAALIEIGMLVRAKMKKAKGDEKGNG